MKKSLLIAFFVIVSVGSLYAQSFQWAHSLGLPNRSRAMGIANDSLGNVYTLGVEKSSAQTIMGLYPIGNLLLEKRNANGDLQWAKHFSGHACGLDIAATPTGSILITGAFYDSLYFGVGDTLKSPGYVDRMFLARFSSDGTCEWATGDTSQWGAIGISITVAGPEDFFICGITEDVEGMLRKYNMQGQRQWEKRFSGVRTIDNLITNTQGDLYISGTCNGQGEFDGIVVPPDTALAQYISYVAKLDANGKAEWLYANAYSTFDISSSLAFDNLGYLCRVRNSKDFQQTIFEVLEPEAGIVMANWEFPTSSGNFDRLITNMLTSTGSTGTLFGPYLATGRFDTTVIYRLHEAISSQGLVLLMDTLATIRGRGLRIEALSLAGSAMFISGYFTDSVLHLGSTELANSNDPTKFQTSSFIARLDIDGITGNVQREAHKSFKVYPNPASEVVELVFDNSELRIIKIYNELGSLIEEVASSAITESIRLTHLPSGVYTIIVHEGTGKTSSVSLVHRQ